MNVTEDLSSCAMTFLPLKKRFYYCILKMKVDLRHKDESTDVQVTSSKKKEIGPPPVIDVGIDLSEFYMSVEWDILQVKYAFKVNQRIMILN